MEAQHAVLSIMGNLSVAHLISEEEAKESSDQQEWALIKRCQSGDSHAMEQIVRQYQNQVYNIASESLAIQKMPKTSRKTCFYACGKRLVSSNSNPVFQRGFIGL